MPDLGSMKYSEMFDLGGRRRSWIVRRDLGVVEVWMVSYPRVPLSWVTGGIEIHRHAEMASVPPTNSSCSLLRCGPCVHDGSSLGFRPISDMMIELGVSAGDKLPLEVLEKIKLTLISWADAHLGLNPAKRRGRGARRQFLL